MIADW